MLRFLAYLTQARMSSAVPWLGVISAFLKLGGVIEWHPMVSMLSCKHLCGLLLWMDL